MDQTTYKEDIWNRCHELFCCGVSKGLRFKEAGKCEIYESIAPEKEEVAVNARYLHRGFYCPSPVFHLVLNNSRRGKILSRPTKRSNVTHRYQYNSEGIYIVEYYFNKSIVLREYIVWEENVRYGYAFDKQGVLGGVSVETYNQGILQNYMWATCRKGLIEQDKWLSDYTHYEEYQYDGSTLTAVDVYFCALIEEDFYASKDVTGLVDHDKYYVVLEAGQIVDLKTEDSSLP